MQPSDPTTQVAPVRCAIYTRKSTEEGLSQEFNSLDAQRECAEAYIQSQRQQGWITLPQRYDDGGYTGGNLERPALQRLLGDIQGGKIDAVIIYKVDRLSRSLFDFARLMHLFDQHGVSFVSVTQQFNSSTPMGRLTLNILLSFAEFERHLVSERTRDKVSAARKKGKWMGGIPVLGYDLDDSRTRLVVNEAEAERVREIFEIFLRLGSLIATLEEIQKRGWRLKSWTTRKGEHHTGRSFDRHSLVRLLSNVLYIGEVKYKQKIYRGEQPAIVERKTLRRTNRLLAGERRGSERPERNRQGAVLKNLLVCARCGAGMAPGYTTTGGRRYSYYVCLTAQKRGARACAGGQIAKERLEAAVVGLLYEAAAGHGGERLRQQLPPDRVQWDGLGTQEQQRIVKMAVEQISYDRRCEQGRLRLRPEVAINKGEELLFRAGRRPLTEQAAPEKVEKRVMPVMEGRVPRITKLMALAIRLEGLLQEGVASGYADLARLGGISRSRMTQILNLRNLAPVLQEHLLQLPAENGEMNGMTEKAVREISGILDWREQIKQFNELLPDGTRVGKGY